MKGVEFFRKVLLKITRGNPINAYEYRTISMPLCFRVKMYNGGDAENVVTFEVMTM